MNTINRQKPCLSQTEMLRGGDFLFILIVIVALRM